MTLPLPPYPALDTYRIQIDSPEDEAIGFPPDANWRRPRSAAPQVEPAATGAPTSLSMFLDELPPRIGNAVPRIITLLDQARRPLAAREIREVLNLPERTASNALAALRKLNGAKVIEISPSRWVWAATWRM